jgi:hypothetical protein
MFEVPAYVATLRCLPGTGLAVTQLLYSCNHRSRIKDCIFWHIDIYSICIYCDAITIQL